MTFLVTLIFLSMIDISVSKVNIFVFTRDKYIELTFIKFLGQPSWVYFGLKFRMLWQLPLYNYQVYNYQVVSQQF